MCSWQVTWSDQSMSSEWFKTFGKRFLTHRHNKERSSISSICTWPTFHCWTPQDSLFHHNQPCQLLSLRISLCLNSLPSCSYLFLLRCLHPFRLLNTSRCRTSPPWLRQVYPKAPLVAVVSASLFSLWTSFWILVERVESCTGNSSNAQAL